MKELKYYKNNCKENYLHTPISVLRYISELESKLTHPDKALPKRLSNQAYHKAREMSYDAFVYWWDKQI